MENVLMIGADVHSRTILTKFAVGRGAAATRSFENRGAGREAMIQFFRERAGKWGARRISFAYEASGCGFVLHDGMAASGIECAVLAPSRMERSPMHRRRKTDEKDAQRVLDLVRGELLAGNPMPRVWIPDRTTRDDREVARARLDLGEKATKVKAQVQMLLTRYAVEKPEGMGTNWSQRHRQWVAELAAAEAPLAPGARCALQSLLRQLQDLEGEVARLDQALEELSKAPRYAAKVKAATALKGVGMLTALVFLTEMGDLRRFNNRRQIGAYVGLVPSSHESGEQADRKGHITRQGSARVRKVLCQASWSRIRCDRPTQLLHARLVKKNPNKKKIAVVACMRRLAILLWHKTVQVQGTPT